MKNSIKMINNSNELSTLLEEMKDLDVLGLDTEFERRTTFFPKPALLQIQVHNQSYLIDPVQCKNLDELFESLSKKTILMHACREDLEVFRIISDVKIDNFFDTQIAASLTGFDAQISYQNLVNELLDIELGKTETCSDWLQRPLSDEQIQYAADDVIYLGTVNEILLERLKKLGRVDWYNQEMAFLRSLTNEPKHDEYFFKMKGLGRLNKIQLQAAYDLVLWRDSLAKSKDIPRGFIIKDKALVQILKSVGHLEINKHLLNRLDDIHPSFIRKYADELCEIIESPNVSDESKKAINKILQQQPDTCKKIKKNLKLKRDKLADQLDIKSEVLFSNRLLDQCLDMIFFEYNKDWTQELLDNVFSKILNPWRYDLFRTDLLAVIDELSF